MLNQRAIGWFVLFVLLSTLAWATFPSTDMTAQGILGLVFSVSLGFAISSTALCAQSWRNFPSKYIPRGTYRIMYAESNGAAILLALWCHPESGVYRKSQLDKSRLFCIPLEWLTPNPEMPDPPPNRGTNDELVCKRVSGHPVLNVSPGFLAKHPRAQQELKPVTA